MYKTPTIFDKLIVEQVPFGAYLTDLSLLWLWGNQYLEWIHTIENYFCRIKDWRRIATRYDKLARNFLAAATLVGALCWIKL